MDLEFYAACRTERGICRSDVVFLVLDASDEIGTVDKKLAHFCEAEGKPTVLVVNKWDLAEAGGASREQYETWLRDRLPGLRFAPIHFTSASKARTSTSCCKSPKTLMAEMEHKVSTSELNKLLAMAVSRRRPRRIGSSYTKMYYMTQTHLVPPKLCHLRQPRRLGRTRLQPLSRKLPPRPHPLQARAPTHHLQGP